MIAISRKDNKHNAWEHAVEIKCVAANAGFAAGGSLLCSNDLRYIAWEAKCPDVLTQEITARVHTVLGYRFEAWTISRNPRQQKIIPGDVDKLHRNLCTLI